MVTVEVDVEWEGIDGSGVTVTEGLRVPLSWFDGGVPDEALDAELERALAEEDYDAAIEIRDFKLRRDGRV